MLVRPSQTGDARPCDKYICALPSHKVPSPAKDGVHGKFARTACSERQQGGFYEVVCPRPQFALGVTDSGGFSNSLTLLWPRLDAYMSGVWPSLSGLSGLTSLRPGRIFIIIMLRISTVDQRRADEEVKRVYRRETYCLLTYPV